MEPSSTTTPPVVPAEFAGRWIAWDFARTRILASGMTRREARDQAKAKGEQRPVLAKVPAADRVFIVGG